MAKNNIIERKYAAKTGILPTTYRSRGFLPCSVGEKKDGYLQNIGYLGEQLDLYLVSKNIGTLWFGIGKPDKLTCDGLDYVIMIAIHKIDDEARFRKDMYKSKRKSVEEIWQGEHIDKVTDIIRFTPSACNSQPWLVDNEDKLYVYRYKKPGKRGIMSADKVSFYNRIDIGIFICFLELCFYEQNISFKRELFLGNGSDKEKNLNATYIIKTSKDVFNMASTSGFEPLTPGLGDSYSVQLSYVESL